MDVGSIPTGASSLHKQKDKGDLALGFVIARLTQLKWNVGVLLTEHARYDLLAEKDGRTIRVQVKYCSARNNTLKVSLKNSWADKSGNHSRLFNPGDFDLLAVYCPDTNKCYFIWAKDILTTNMIILRLDSGGMRPAENFELIS